MSNDPEQEYFSDGITEEIINSITHIKDLRVASRTSSFHFKGKNADLREVGSKLGVSTVLEGSVRKQGNRLRVTAQLINVHDGFHIWSERYDRDMDDIFAVQDEIALAITEKFKITLLDNEKAVIYKNPTENKEAYDLYLKGQFYFNKRGTYIKKGLEYFLLAVQLDPTFSLAYSGIADCYSILGFYSIIYPHIAMPKAKENAEKAIQLDPTNAGAHTTLAFIAIVYDWDWTLAKQKFQLIFNLNPNYALAHYWYSYYLSFVEGKFEESIRWAQKAAEQLEPFVSLSHHALAVVYINAGKFEKAIESSKLAIELDPNTFLGFRSLAVSLAALHRYDEAIEAFKTSVMLSARHPWLLVELCCLYAWSGHKAESQKIMDELMMRAETEFVSGIFAAAYHLKYYDKTTEYLERAFSQHDGSLITMTFWPVSSFIRTDHRYQQFFKRMNFPE